MTTTNTTTFDPRKIEEQRFEFSFYINQTRFIVQRFFNIRDYNEDSIKSIELKELMDRITGMNNGEWGEMGIIPKFLKKKSVEYLWSNYNPYATQEEVIAAATPRNTNEKIDNFQFEIKVDKAIVAKSEFSGNVFPPKVRYDVNIKEIIPSIIAEIRSFLSQKNYNVVEVKPTAYDIYYNEGF